MVDAKASDTSKPAADARADSKPETKAPAARGGDSGPGKGTGDELQARHEARTKVPGRDGVDARLDNRSVEDLEPPAKYGPDDAKPQHISGPDVAGQVEHTREVLGKRKKG